MNDKLLILLSSGSTVEINMHVDNFNFDNYVSTALANGYVCMKTANGSQFWIKTAKVTGFVYSKTGEAELNIIPPKREHLQ